jgi:two-component system, NarL family, sensor histidine kinase DevS
MGRHEAAPREDDHGGRVMAPLANDGVAWALLEGSPDGVIICDDRGTIVLVNRQSETLFGYTRPELVGQMVEMLIPPGRRHAHVEHREQYVVAPHTRPMGASMQLSAVRRDDSTFPVEVALSPVDTPSGRLVIATVRDISSRLEAQDELEDARMRTMLAEDRERIARDLHDTVIQRLFADGLTLQAVLHRVPSDVQARLQNVLDDHDDAIREIRTTIFGLGRSRAGESGLRRELVDVVDQAARILGFRPALRLGGVLEGQLAASVEADLLATLRETLSNAARHAGATTMEIDVVAEKQHLSLTVTDNGVGLPSERIGAGNGLNNIRTRAEELGGECTFSAREGGGTVVRWIVPIT